MVHRMAVLCAAASALLVAGLFLLSRPPGGAAGEQPPEIILFSEEGFQGEKLAVRESLFDLPVLKSPSGEEFDWNDKTKSVIVVKGTWRLYQHGRFNTELDDTPPEAFRASAKAPRPGWSCVVSAPPGRELRIPSVAQGGLFWDVSSIELLSGESLPEWSSTMRKR